MIINCLLDIGGSHGLGCTDTTTFVRWEDEGTCYFKSSPTLTMRYARAEQECEKLDSELVQVVDPWEGSYILEKVYVHVCPIELEFYPFIIVNIV